MLALHNYRLNGLILHMIAVYYNLDSFTNFSEKTPLQFLMQYFEPKPKPKVDAAGRNSRSPSFIFPINPLQALVLKNCH